MSELDLKQLKEHFAGKLVGCKIDFHSKITSAMDEAERQAEVGAPEGLVVIAEEQTKGRGRFSRPWISPAKQDLLFSVLLRPSVTQLRFMNMAATLATCAAVEQSTNMFAGIKWPNDLRVNGRKIAGILVESTLESQVQIGHTVLGIGLNVNSDPSLTPEIAETATSISRLLKRSVDRTKVLIILLERLNELYQTIQSGISLTNMWSERLETLGKLVKIEFREGCGHVVEGRARSVDEEGNLLVELPDGKVKTLVAGEVTLQV